MPSLIRPKSLLLHTAALLLTLARTLAKDWDGTDLPNPTRSSGFAACGFDRPTRICDPDKLLNFGGGDSQRDAIDWMDVQLKDIVEEVRQETIFYAEDGNARCANVSEPVKFWAVTVFDIAKIPPVPDYWSEDLQKRFITDNDMPGGVVSIARIYRRKLTSSGLGYQPRNRTGYFTDGDSASGGANGTSAAVVKTGGNTTLWPWLLWVIIVVAIILLLICGLLACFTYTACYHKKRTGKWRLIPIRVHRVSEAGKPVYPEYASQSKTLDMPSSYPPQAYLQDYAYATAPHPHHKYRQQMHGSTSDILPNSGTDSPGSGIGRYPPSGMRNGGMVPEQTPSPMADVDTVSTASEPGYAAPTKTDARTATIMSSRHQSPE